MNITALILTKTFWAAVISIVTAVASYCTGEITLNSLLPTLTTAVIGACIRDGMIQK